MRVRKPITARDGFKPAIGVRRYPRVGRGGFEGFRDEAGAALDAGVQRLASKLGGVTAEPPVALDDVDLGTETRQHQGCGHSADAPADDENLWIRHMTFPSAKAV